MAVLTACLFFIFGQYQTGSTTDYSAVFNDASRLKAGESVRVGGLRVGTVNSVKLQKDKTALVTFDADPAVQLTTGTQAAVRYLNLVGDRYLELIDGPGDRRLPPGSQIPTERTQPALDLDLLLGGLKPVIRGLNPQDVNALTASLIQIFQGQGGTLSRCCPTRRLHHRARRTQSDDRAADRQSADTVVHAEQGGRQVLRHDRQAGDVGQPACRGARSDRHRHRTAGQRHRIAGRPAHRCAAATRGHRRPAEPVGHQLDGQKDRLDASLQKAPENYRKLSAPGPTAASSTTTSASSSSGPPICRAAPWCSRGSGRTRGGAPSPDAEIPWQQAHSGRIHRRRPVDPHRARRPVARDVDVDGRRRCATRRCSPRRAA